MRGVRERLEYREGVVVGVSRRDMMVLCYGYRMSGGTSSTVAGTVGSLFNETRAGCRQSPETRAFDASVVSIRSLPNRRCTRRGGRNGGVRAEVPRGSGAWWQREGEGAQSQSTQIGRI